MLENSKSLVQILQSLLLLFDDNLQNRSWVSLVSLFEDVDSSVALFDSVLGSLYLDLISFDHDLSLDRN